MSQVMMEAADLERSAVRTTSLEITVLAGGPGVEREVSLNSGTMVRDALRRLGHHAIMLDIGPVDLAALDVPADMIFIALHGVFGEDGQVQELLEDRRIPYCGSDAQASAIAMDKVATKAKMIEREIPTPRFDLIKPARLAESIQTIELPVVVKPRSSGSSVDTYIARTREQLAAALETVVSRFGAALVERYVNGPELTVGVFNDRALPVCQIRTKREFYDYQAKYIDDDTEYLFDIDLPDELLRRVQAMSVETSRAVGCRDFSRVDWMVEVATMQPYAIEINTIPGMTSHSLLPKAAARAGISFDELCQCVVELTMERARKA